MSSIRGKVWECIDQKPWCTYNDIGKLLRMSCFLPLPRSDMSYASNSEFNFPLAATNDSMSDNLPLAEIAMPIVISLQKVNACDILAQSICYKTPPNERYLSGTTCKERLLQQGVREVLFSKTVKSMDVSA